MPNGHGHEHTVLLVDDDTDTREALAMLLQHCGINAVTAGGGVDALAQLRAGVRPCIVLLDLRMPDVDGWQLGRAIKGDPSLATIPLIIVSGDYRCQRGADQDGIAEALLKPVDPEILIRLAERHCRRAR
jgi:CheY-like chemotaxis protein